MTGILGLIARGLALVGTAGLFARGFSAPVLVPFRPGPAHASLIGWDASAAFLVPGASAELIEIPRPAELLVTPAAAAQLLTSAPSSFLE